jgi:hypothetical protein
MMRRGRIQGLAVSTHALSVAKSTEAVEIAGQRNCGTCLDREGQASSEIIAVTIYKHGRGGSPLSSQVIVPKQGLVFGNELDEPSRQSSAAEMF